MKRKTIIVGLLMLASAGIVAYAIKKKKTAAIEDSTNKDYADLIKRIDAAPK